MTKTADLEGVSRIITYYSCCNSTWDWPQIVMDDTNECNKLEDEINPNPEDVMQDTFSPGSRKQKEWHILPQHTFNTSIKFVFGLITFVNSDEPLVRKNARIPDVNLSRNCPFERINSLQCYELTRR